MPRQGSNLDNRSSSSNKRATLGCLGVLAVVAAVVAVSSIVAELPKLPYLLLALLVLTIVGLIKDRPPELRAFVSSHVGVLFIGLTIVSVGSVIGWGRASDRAAEARAAAEQAEATRQEQKRLAEAEEARKAQLRASAPITATRISQGIANLKAAVESERWNEVPSISAAIANDVAPYVQLDNVPEVMRAMMTEASRARSEVEPISKARAAFARGRKQLDAGKSAQAGGDFVGARAAFRSAQAELEQLSPDLARYVPERSGFISEATAAERRIRAKATQQQKQQDRAAAKAREASEQRSLQAEACGPEPQRSPWNEVYTAVESYLEENANDPDSVDVSRCGQAVLTDKCWVTRCTFRAKNAFGGLVREARDFYIARNNTVISVSERFAPR